MVREISSIYVCNNLFKIQHQIYFHFRRELLKTIVECEQCKIIVTHGTDTIIETAKYLQIQLQEDSKMFEKRIILTGNLSKGIDNCFGVWHKHQNSPFGNSFSNIFIFFSTWIIFYIKNVGHVYIQKQKMKKRTNTGILSPFYYKTGTMVQIGSTKLVLPKWLSYGMFNRVIRVVRLWFWKILVFNSQFASCSW